MDERRSVPRWSINQDAQLQIEDHPYSIPCTVEDISINGMRLSLGRRLFAEAFSNISLTLGEALNFSAGAHVAHEWQSAGKNTYGLLFSNIEDVQRSRIKEYIHNNFIEHEKKIAHERWWKGTV